MARSLDTYTLIWKSTVATSLYLIVSVELIVWRGRQVVVRKTRFLWDWQANQRIEPIANQLK